VGLDSRWRMSDQDNGLVALVVQIVELDLRLLGTSEDEKSLRHPH